MNNNQQQKCLSVESSAVQTHLEIVQNNIQRMDTKTTFCKTWCITVVSVIFVLFASISRSDLVWVALVPTVLFYILDVRYFALEEAYRQSYDDFVSKLHKNQVSSEDLYSVHIDEREISSHQQFEAAKAFSVHSIYSALIVLIILIYSLVL